MRIFIVLFSLVAAGCQTSGVIPISKRGMGGFDKPGTSYMHGRAPGQETRPELYVGKKIVTVEPKAPDNTTGSLFMIDDQRNYLYAAQAPFAVDQFIDVKVSAMQTERKEGEKKNAEEAPTDDSGDTVVKDLLEALPQLDPGPNGDKLVKNIKMKIAHVFENGDALVVLKRNSRKADDGREVAVRARIPYTALISGKPITTTNLVDVHWVDTLDGELTERFSSGWEDEYSLRLSGFTEAKSLYAQQLEDKRKEMTALREKVKNQLISIGKERTKLANERQQWSEDKAKAEEKVKVLEEQVEEQKEKISEMQPQPESPGERRDGANGA